MVKKVVIVFSATVVLISSCYNQKEELLYPLGANCNGINAKFSVDVNPIIQTNCAISGCHDGSSTNGPGPLTSYDRIRDAASRIRTAVVDRTMPKGSTLSTDDIRKIVCWIDSGTPNN